MKGILLWRFIKCNIGVTHDKGITLIDEDPCTAKGGNSANQMSPYAFGTPSQLVCWTYRPCNISYVIHMIEANHLVMHINKQGTLPTGLTFVHSIVPDYMECNSNLCLLPV